MIAAAEGAPSWDQALRGSILLTAAVSFCGAFAVYNIDRVRDLDRDLPAWPLRSHFVTHHRRSLTWTAALAGMAGAACALQLPPAARAVGGAILLLGLGHRRLKERALAKIVYVSAAWVGVVVVIPALASRAVAPPTTSVWIAGIVGAAIAANLIVSSLGEPGLANRDSFATFARWGFGPVGAARASAGVGVALALLGPSPLRPLACVPAAQLLGLLADRRSERALLGVVDGALFAGAVAALVIMLQ